MIAGRVRSTCVVIRKLQTAICVLLCFACTIEVAGQNQKEETHTPAKVNQPPEGYFSRENIATMLRGDVNRYEFSAAQLERLRKALQMSDAQAQAVENYFADYKSQVNDRWLKMADEIRDSFVELIEGTNGGSMDQMDAFGRERAAKIMKSIAAAMDRARDDSDTYRDVFIEKSTAVLTEEQQARMPSGLRDLRRELLLQPENPRGPRYDLDRLADLVALYEAASKPEQEFAVLKEARSDGDETAVQLAAVRDQIEATLSQYTIELDALLQQSYRQEWDLRVKLILARIVGDEQDAKSANRIKMATWRKLYDLTERTVQSIGSAIEPALGIHARTAWMARYEKITFPDLCAPETPDVMVIWLRDQAIGPDVARLIEQEYEIYLRAREPLRVDAKKIRANLRMKRDPLHPELAPASLERGLPDELANVERSRADLAKKTTDRFRGLLASDMQRRFDVELDDVLERSYARFGAVVRY